METTFYQFGVLYLRWTNHKGIVFEAVKEQVDFLGKEVFEQDLEDDCDDLNVCLPDRVSYTPAWEPSLEQIAESLRNKYAWLRDQEIC